MPDTWTELEEERHSLPNTSKDGSMHSTTIPLEVVEFPRCNNTDIEWYGRMPTDTPLVDLKIKKLPKQCKREDATPETTDPMTDNGFHIEIGRNVCWDKSNTVLVSQTQYLAAKSGKKRRYCTTLIIHMLLYCCYPNARQSPYQITKKPFYTAPWQLPEAPEEQYEP